LYDENASSHIALGAPILQAVEWAGELSPEERVERGVNHSSIHTDFMIGSNELEVDGVTGSGDAVPILRAGDWLLEWSRPRSGRSDSNRRLPPPKGGALTRLSYVPLLRRSVGERGGVPR